MTQTSIKTTLFALILALSLSPALAQNWQPSRTHAVVVGVLEWENPAIPGFSKEKRQDMELRSTLEQRGVPPENIVILIDREATRDAVLKALETSASQTAPDETLIFYYAGHGVIRNGKIQFAGYDWSPQSAIEMDDLTEAIAGRCQGRVLLTADCCYSGGLAQVADSLNLQGLAAASLASASAEVPSQSNWTFTMTLIEALEGRRSADLNNDHKITLSETADLVAQCMKYYDRQQHSYLNAGFGDPVLTYVTTIRTRPILPPPFRAYEWAQTDVQEDWAAGRLVGYDEGFFSLLTQAYNERPVISTTSENLWNFPPKPEPLSERERLEKASVNGKYGNLLRTLPREYDYLTYTGFKELGKQEITDYNGFTDLPPGYWVYVYPNWYIWGSEI